MARRSFNPQTLVTAGLVIGGGYVLMKMLKLFGKFGDGYDKAADATANAIVNMTHKPTTLAKGITYILPNGSRVLASQVQASTGGTFISGGVRYKLVAATPPGSGIYTAARA